MEQHKYKLKSNFIDHDKKLAKYGVDMLFFLVKHPESEKDAYVLEVYKTEGDTQSDMFGATMVIGGEKDYNECKAILENKSGRLQICTQVKGDHCGVLFQQDLLFQKEAYPMKKLPGKDLIEYLLDKQHCQSNYQASIISSKARTSSMGTQVKSDTLHGFTQTVNAQHQCNSSQTPIVEKAHANTQHEEPTAIDGSLVKIHAKKPQAKELESTDENDYESADLNKVGEKTSEHQEKVNKKLEEHKYSYDRMAEIRQIVNAKPASDFNKEHESTISSLGISVVNPPSRRGGRGGYGSYGASSYGISEKENIKPEEHLKNEQDDSTLSAPISQESIKMVHTPADVEMEPKPTEKSIDDSGFGQSDALNDNSSEYISADRTRQSSGLSQASGASGRGGYKSEHNKGYEEKMTKPTLNYIPYGDPDLARGVSPASTRSDTVQDSARGSRGSSFGESNRGRGTMRGGTGLDSSFGVSGRGRGSFGSQADLSQESGRGRGGGSYTGYQSEMGSRGRGGGSFNSSNTGQEFGYGGRGRGSMFGSASNGGYQQESYGGRGRGRGNFGGNQETENGGYQQESFGGRGRGRGNFGGSQDADDSGFGGSGRGGYGSSRGGYGGYSSSSRGGGNRGGYQIQQSAQPGDFGPPSDQEGFGSGVQKQQQADDQGSNHDGEW